MASTENKFAKFWRDTHAPASGGPHVGLGQAARAAELTVVYVREMCRGASATLKLRQHIVQGLNEKIWRNLFFILFIFDWRSATLMAVGV